VLLPLPPVSDDENQVPVPQSFVALFVPPGRSQPTESRAVISVRHEFCDDLATMLTEHASTKLFELGVAETDVLERVHLGLLADAALLTPDEAWWVVHRLAELLGWPAPPASVARPAAPA
jgi:hypothetical protein